jgi:hypothetical protein
VTISRDSTSSGLCGRSTFRRRNVSRNAVVSACVLLVSCLAYCSTQKMEALIISETSADFYRTSRRYNPEDRSLCIIPQLHCSFFLFRLPSSVAVSLYVLSFLILFIYFTFFTPNCENARLNKGKSFGIITRLRLGKRRDVGSIPVECKRSLYSPLGRTRLRGLPSLLHNGIRSSNPGGKAGKA